MTVEPAPSRRPDPTVEVGRLPLPCGWFAVATSRRLQPGHRRAARVGGVDLVLWRTDAGMPAAAGAWCPHLGAHLGHCGRVDGEVLECGFHGFRFDAHGRCVATGYGGRVPSRAHLSPWVLHETGDVVLAWFDPAGGPPRFDPPDLSADGLTAPAWRARTFAGHPLETTENSVDLGHLRVLHGYDAVEVVRPAETDGPVLRATYRMTRGGRASGIPLPRMRTEFDVTVHGLGVSTVELTLPDLGVRQRLHVLPTPLGDGTVCLRLGVAGRRDLEAPMPPGLRRLPGDPVARLLARFTLLGLVSDVAQDRRVWTTKRHLPRPVLAEGDGPIGLYRRWAQQFFDDPEPTR